MTRCRQVRDWILVAELEELEAGLGVPGAARREASGLTGHLRGCGTCQEAARAVLEGQALLAGVFAHLDGRDAAEGVEAVMGALERAAHPSDAGSGRIRTGVDAPPRRHAWRPAQRALGASLLAAAAVTALALGLRSEPAPVAGTPLARPVAEAPDVVATSDLNVAVLPTVNPDITVLWFYER